MLIDARDRSRLAGTVASVRLTALPNQRVQKRRHRRLSADAAQDLLRGSNSPRLRMLHGTESVASQMNPLPALGRQSSLRVLVGTVPTGENERLIVHCPRRRRGWWKTNGRSGARRRTWCRRRDAHPVPSGSRRTSGVSRDRCSRTGTSAAPMTSSARAACPRAGRSPAETAPHPSPSSRVRHDHSAYSVSARRNRGPPSPSRSPAPAP